MNEIQIFKNVEFGQIRTVIIDDEPYFVGKDVAEILGYTDTYGALKKHVDNEDRQNCQNDSFETPRGMIVINESGLYSLILSSKLSEAKKFKRWVTSEVLPSIRKHGLYAVDDLINNPDLAIKAFTALKEERDKNARLELTVKEQGLQIEEMKPKATYYDMVLNSETLVPITTISKDYGWSAQKLNKYLYEKGVQYKRGGRWFLYQKYSECGYTGSKTIPNGFAVFTQMQWTQEGRLFIYELLKVDGILPIMELEANKEAM